MWYFCQAVVFKFSTTGAVVSSFFGASCTKSSKDVFRSQSYILDVAFAKIVHGFKYISALHLQKSAKMQLLNKLSEILHKFVSSLFFKTVLKATSNSKPFQFGNPSNKEVSWEICKCLEECYFWVATSGIGLNIP